MTRYDVLNDAAESLRVMPARLMAVKFDGRGAESYLIHNDEAGRLVEVPYGLTPIALEHAQHGVPSRIVATDGKRTYRI